MKKIIVWIIFLCLTVVVFVLLLKPQKDNVGTKLSDTAKTDQTDMDIQQKVMAFTIDGRSSKGAKQWQLKGQSAEIQEDEIHLNQLEAVAYSEKGTVNITSNKGIYRKTKGEVELLGEVKVRSEEGTTLETERAIWVQGSKEVTTEDFVFIKRQGMTAAGVGGRANADDNTAALYKSVTVTMEPATRVDCDGALEVEYNNNRAVFHKNVRVRDKEGILFADKLTIDFDSETQEVVQGTAEGNVKIKRGKSYTLSQKAVYTESTKSAELLGRPRIIIDPEELAELEKRENKKSFIEGI
ncbi:MAG: LPS export ABC transporter periplasmic protein LptC [Candidatus Omnitrophota bacterium]|nr:LPS export ABC transporter periplasmic protein LptC [Candidatus Omnitrophota bacterium]